MQQRRRAARLRCRSQRASRSQSSGRCRSLLPSALRACERGDCRDLPHHLPHIIFDPLDERLQLRLAALDPLQIRFPLPGHRRTLHLRMHHLNQPDALVRRLQILPVAHDVFALQQHFDNRSARRRRPQPAVSFIASDSSFSSSVLPAVSIAVSSVASVSRFGARVFFLTLSTLSTSCACPRARPGGQSLLFLLSRRLRLSAFFVGLEIQHLPAHLLRSSCPKSGSDRSDRAVRDRRDDRRHRPHMVLMPALSNRRQTRS